MSKGSKRRPRSVDEKEYNRNWDLVFSELCDRTVRNGRIEDDEQYEDLEPRGSLGYNS